MFCIPNLTRRACRTLAVMLFAVGTLVAPASSVRTVNLEQMAERAATVFSGRCLEVRVERDPALGREVTLVTFEVHRAIKGDVAATHTIRLAGANGEPSKWSVAGLPTFLQGEELVIFLYGESASGFTSPVGFGQGKFRVVRDKLGRPFAVNEYGNAHLLRGVSELGVARMNVSRPGWRKQPVMHPDQLLDMADTFARTAP